MYKITIYGYEIDATCHELNQEQAVKLFDEQRKNNKDELSHLGYGVENVLQDFYLYEQNVWGVNRPLINDGLHFTLSSSDGGVLSEFRISEIVDQVEFDTHSKQQKFLIQPVKFQKNYLLYYEINKGEICECSIGSDEPPNLKAISYSTGKIQHPDGFILFLDKLYYEGKELSCSYENNEVSGKTTFMKIWKP